MIPLPTPSFVTHANRLLGARIFRVADGDLETLSWAFIDGSGAGVMVREVTFDILVYGISEISTSIVNK